MTAPRASPTRHRERHRRRLAATTSSTSAARTPQATGVRYLGAGQRQRRRWTDHAGSRRSTPSLTNHADTGGVESPPPATTPRPATPTSRQRSTSSTRCCRPAAMAVNRAAPVASIDATIRRDVRQRPPRGHRIVSIHSQDAQGNWGDASASTWPSTRRVPTTVRVSAHRPTPNNGTVPFATAPRPIRRRSPPA